MHQLAPPQSVLSTTLATWQPLTASQLSVVQALPSLQTTAILTQLRFLHTSPVVHASLSGHGAMLALCRQPLDL